MKFSQRLQETEKRKRRGKKEMKIERLKNRVSKTLANRKSGFMKIARNRKRKIEEIFDKATFFYVHTFTGQGWKQLETTRQKAEKEYRDLDLDLHYIGDNLYSIGPGRGDELYYFESPVDPKAKPEKEVKKLKKEPEKEKSSKAVWVYHWKTGKAKKYKKIPSKYDWSLGVYFPDIWQIPQVKKFQYDKKEAGKQIYKLASLFRKRGSYLYMIVFLSGGQPVSASLGKFGMSVRVGDAGRVTQGKKSGDYLFISGMPSVDKMSLSNFKEALPIQHRSIQRMHNKMKAEVKKEFGLSPGKGRVFFLSPELGVTEYQEEKKEIHFYNKKNKKTEVFSDKGVYEDITGEMEKWIILAVNGWVGIDRVPEKKIFDFVKKKLGLTNKRYTRDILKKFDEDLKKTLKELVKEKKIFKWSTKPPRYTLTKRLGGSKEERKEE